MKDIRTNFIRRMEHELRANRHQGIWADWHPNVAQCVRDLEHHLAKLKSALLTGNAKLVSEHAADLANIAMKADEVHGAPLRAHAHTTRHQRLTWLMTNAKVMACEPQDPANRREWTRLLFEQMQEAGLYSPSTNWFDCTSTLRELLATARAALVQKSK